MSNMIKRQTDQRSKHSVCKAHAGRLEAAAAHIVR